MKYRSRTDIIAIILKSANNGGQTKTHLMYGAYLSYAQIQEYVRYLLDKGLLMSKAGEYQMLYHLTERGLGYLRSYDEMTRLLTEPITLK